MAITGSTDFGDGLLNITVDHDPTSVATDAPIGSLIIQVGTSSIYKKLDSGATTNVVELLSNTSLPKRYLDGYELARSGTNPNYQLTISEGECRSDDNTTDIKTSGNLTADITASGANGLDTGSEATSTWYYVYVIYNPTTSTVASLLSVNPTSPTMPAGYTKKRFIGSWYNSAAGNFRVKEQLVANGRYREYNYTELSRASVQVLTNGGAFAWNPINCSVFIPATSTLGIFVGQHIGASLTTRLMLRKNGSSQTDPIKCVYGGNGAFPPEAQAGSEFTLRTDSSRIIEYQNDVFGPTSNLWVLGYKEIL